MRWLPVLLLAVATAVARPRFSDVLDRIFRSITGPLDVATSEFKSVCMGELGCFYTGAPYFHPVYRNVSLEPAPRDSILTRLVLLRRGRSRTLLRLGGVYRVPLDSTPFDPEATTRVIIHGFIENINISTWIEEMAEALLEVEDINVVLVDWGNGNDIPYTKAVANSRVVAAELVDFVRDVQATYNTSWRLGSNFHIIGHSIGAHIAGLAGAELPYLSRITGLDPAGPGFNHLNPRATLDPSDAEFVDVIHTDASWDYRDGFGSPLPAGHVDFFVNGGDNQPGCSRNLTALTKSMGLLKGVIEFQTCEHLRAGSLFLESILANTSLMPYGTECPEGYPAYLAARCVGKPVVLGLRARRPLRSMGPVFLLTGAESPFAAYHYRVKIFLEDFESRKMPFKEITLGFSEESGDSIELSLKPDPEVRALQGGIFSYLSSSPERVSHPRMAALTWVPQSGQEANLTVARLELRRLEALDHSGELIAASEWCFSFGSVEPYSRTESVAFC